MRILLTMLIISLGYCTYAIAQDTTSLKRMICRFEVPGPGPYDKELGTGFIAGRRGDSLYLVSAGHVFKYHTPGTPVKVILGNTTDTLEATQKIYRYDGYKEDLAVYTVSAKGYTYPELKPLDTLQAHIPVFYYHHDHLYTESGDSDQILITMSDTIRSYKIYMPMVAGSDSGGPVFTCGPNPYLVGIIISGAASCEVFRISYILDMIKKELPGLTL